jgi:hypothetical protein
MRSLRSSVTSGASAIKRACRGGLSGEPAIGRRRKVFLGGARCLGASRFKGFVYSASSASAVVLALNRVSHASLQRGPTKWHFGIYGS